MWGAQMSCLDDRLELLFRWVICFKTIFLHFPSGHLPALLPYVSWGTTCMSFWQKTVVETAGEGKGELFGGHAITCLGSQGPPHHHDF